MSDNPHCAYCTPTCQTRAALVAMGYSERKAGHWLKPVGFQSFSYHEGKKEWCNWILTARNEVALWERKSLAESECPLLWLKERECFTRTDVYIHGNSQFELSDTSPTWVFLTD